MWSDRGQERAIMMCKIVKIGKDEGKTLQKRAREREKRERGG